VILAMEASAGVKLEELRADGGATTNAAYLAGVATGTWSEEDVRAMWNEAARYESRIGEDQRGAARGVETGRYDGS
jgi:glycerol kinase